MFGEFHNHLNRRCFSSGATLPGGWTTQRGDAAWFTLGIALLLSVSFGLGAQEKPEPNYFGQTVQQLLNKLDAPDPDVRLNAAEQVVQIGSAEAKAAVPRLIEFLGTENARNSFYFYRVQRAQNALVRLGPVAAPHLIDALDLPDSPVRDRVSKTLERMGPTIAPNLAKALNHKHRRVQVEIARLLAIDAPEASKAVPILVQELNDPNPETRSRAISALSAIGPRAQAALPSLIHTFVTAQRSIVTDESSLRGNLRASALSALCDLGPAGAPAVPLFLDGLKDQDSLVRWAAAAALGNLGPEARVAIPRLRSMMTDNQKLHDVYSVYARLEAADTFWKLTRRAEVVIPTIAEGLSDEHWYLREKAAHQLESMGAVAKEAVPALRKAMATRDASSTPDVDVSTRIKIAKALWVIDGHPEAVLPLLTKALGHEHWAVRQKAALVLGEIGHMARPALPALVKLLKDEDAESGAGYRYVRLAAAEALWRIDAQPELTLPTILSALRQEEDAGEWVQAANTLKFMGSNAKPALPDLIKTLSHDRLYDGCGTFAYYFTRRIAPFETLSSMGAAAQTAVPALHDALSDSDPLIRLVAAEALWKIDPQAKAAVRAMTMALRDRCALVRLRAADGLAGVGPSAKESVSTLLEVMSDEYDEVRAHAIMALGQIGPESKVAVPALTKAMKDTNKNIQKAAAVALRKIDPDMAKKVGIP
jgi:HEAT repeat protein